MLSFWPVTFPPVSLSSLVHFELYMLYCIWTSCLLLLQSFLVTFKNICLCVLKQISSIGQGVWLAISEPKSVWVSLSLSFFLLLQHGLFIKKTPSKGSEEMQPTFLLYHLSRLSISNWRGSLQFTLLVKYWLHTVWEHLAALISFLSLCIFVL